MTVADQIGAAPKHWKSWVLQIAVFEPFTESVIDGTWTAAYWPVGSIEQYDADVQTRIMNLYRAQVGREEGCQI